MFLRKLFNNFLRGMAQLEYVASRASGTPEPPPVIPPEILEALRCEIYVGPAITDPDMFDRLPVNYADLLRKTNGFIRYGGGLHVRGACIEPDWHSLRTMWDGEKALHKLYPGIRPEGIPFGGGWIG